MNILSLVILSSIFAIAYSIYLAINLLALPSGNQKMQEISLAIQEGAATYLFEQYKIITIVGIIIFGMLFVIFNYQIWISMGFVIGAIASGLSGYIGMYVAVRANVRTTESAKTGLASALNTAFNAGAVSGFALTGLALLSISGYYSMMSYFNLPEKIIMDSIITLGFGASLVSIFARLGGGIFTKGADVGADYVGKVESNIPEDDPRNPAVIADNVGDNVGDCAGMSADVFETYVVTMIGSILIANIAFPTDKIMMLYPLAIAAISIVCCIIGSKFVILGSDNNIMKSLYKGLVVSIFLSAISIYVLTYYFFNLETLSMYGLSINKLFMCSLIGFVVTIFLVLITEYYTSINFSPVKKLAESSTKGEANNIIMGLAIGMESTVMPIIVICLGIIFTYILAGSYGIALSVVAMLSLSGIIVALDAYGPITDNAGGIAEMSGLGKNIRQITDALDSVGNTTKAITKGYAIGSAGLGAMVLFNSFNGDVNYFIAHGNQFVYFNELIIDYSLTNPFVIVGLILGGCLPFLFASMSMVAVGRASSDIVDEVRRQFKEKKILEGIDKPDYNKAITILTHSAIREMIIPSLLPVIMPILVFLIFNSFVSKSSGIEVLGSMLLGIIITGLYVAISMTNSGAAWDNAKKYIESGHYGGKGSLAHKASVIGDTIGDPYKDTAGPAINPMIKVTNIIALILLIILAM